MSRQQQPDDFESEGIFHEHEWRIQRIGWWILTLFLVLALAGLFGKGPLSHARAEAATGRIEYEHFIRYGTPAEFVITPSGRAAGGTSRVAISSDYLEAFRVERITPEPTSARIAGGHVVYEFATSSPGASISFEVDPRQLWRHRAVVRIDGGPPLEIWQLTYP
jgi:hypothetical protein